MPIITPTETTAPVFYPSSDYKIARYLDLTKFLSLIQTEKIFFNRLDLFEDQFEGTLPELSYDEYEKWLRQVVYSHSTFINLTESDKEKKIKKDIKDYRKNKNDIRKNFYISCWNKFETESYALWKIYSNLNSGIAIVTTPKKIVQAFKNTREDVQLSEIRYIDFKKDIINIGNINFPVIHKNRFYDYEKEIRLIHQTNLLKTDPSDEKIDNGKYISIDINELIDEIIISPYAKDWFFNIVEDLLNKYNISKTLKFSDLR